MDNKMEKRDYLLTRFFYNKCYMTSFLVETISIKMNCTVIIVVLLSNYHIFKKLNSRLHNTYSYFQHKKSYVFFYLFNKIKNLFCCNLVQIINRKYEGIYTIL